MREMTLAEYYATPNDYRGTHQGIPYLLYMETETGKTIYGPVKLTDYQPTPDQYRTVKNAIRECDLLLPGYIPEVGNTQVIRLSYGRLKLIRMTPDLVWTAFLWTHQHDPDLDNLLHLSPAELTRLSRTLAE